MNIAKTGIGRVYRATGAVISMTAFIFLLIVGGEPLRPTHIKIGLLVLAIGLLVFLVGIELTLFARQKPKNIASVLSKPIIKEAVTAGILTVILSLITVTSYDYEFARRMMTAYGATLFIILWSINLFLSYLTNFGKQQ